MCRVLKPISIVAALSAPLTAQAADMAMKAAAPVPFAQGPAVELFGGVSAAPDTIYGYAGGLYAFNQNLLQNGFLFRVSGGDGEYSYDRLVGVKQNVDFQNGDFSVGYQAYFDNGVHITGYLGANVENDSNNDPLAEVKGTKWGVKGQGEIYAPLGSSFYAYALGTYSSAWSSYLTLGKVGYDLTNKVSIGPEVMALGSVSYGSVRTGPFIAYSLSPTMNLVASGGYSWNERNNSIKNEDGAYGSLYLSTAF